MGAGGSKLKSVNLPDPAWSIVPRLGGQPHPPRCRRASQAACYRKQISTETLYNLEHNLLLFLTGFTRIVSAILAEQGQKTRGGDSGMIEHLRQIKEFGWSGAICAVSPPSCTSTGSARSTGRNPWPIPPSTSTTVGGAPRPFPGRHAVRRTLPRPRIPGPRRHGPVLQVPKPLTERFFNRPILSGAQRTYKPLAPIWIGATTVKGPPIGTGV